MAINKAKMKCNSPKRQISGGKKFVVKACKGGKEKIIRFGDANMNRCDTANDKFSARYWSCKNW